MNNRKLSLTSSRIKCRDVELRLNECCVVKDMISEVNEAVQDVTKGNETKIETDRKEAGESSSLLNRFLN